MNIPALERLLNILLHVDRFTNAGDLHGVFLPPSWPDAPLRHLGLALEPGPGWRAWIGRERIDAVFLHRPWGLEPATRHALGSAGIGVLAYHLAFDEHLTTGLNPLLAAACGWGEPAWFAEKAGRPLGMICALPGGPVAASTVRARLEAEFGELEAVTPPVAGPDAPVGQVACVGAMNDRLVRAAQGAGAGIYVTGQWRPPARQAVLETGIGVVAIGHRRSEDWGLRTLARLLRANPAMAGVEVSVFPGEAA